MGAFEDAAEAMAAERDARLARGKKLTTRMNDVVQEFLSKVSAAEIKPIPLGIQGRQVIRRKGLIRPTTTIQNEYHPFKDGWVVEPGKSDRESPRNPEVVSTDGQFYEFPNKGYLWARPGEAWVGAPAGPFYAFNSPGGQSPIPKRTLDKNEGQQLIRHMVAFIEFNR